MRALSYSYSLSSILASILASTLASKRFFILGIRVSSKFSIILEKTLNKMLHLEKTHN